MKGNSSEEHLSTSASIVLSVWFSLSGLAAVTGNMVALWLFYKHKSLRTISNRFLASLSMADAFVGLVIDPVLIVIICWIQPEVHSNLFLISIMLWIHTTAATTLNSCCVSIDRFIAIRFPYRYQDILTERRCFAVIILVWFISLCLPFLVFLRERNGPNELLVSIAFTICLVPLLVVCFCYILIFKLARKQFRRILPAKNIPDSGENVRFRVMQNFKAIKTVGFVLSACIITWMPSVVLQLVKFYYMEEEKRCRLRKLTFVVSPWVEAIAFTSSAINPLIYYFRNSDFRRAFRRTFHWLPCVHEQDASHLRAQPERNRLNQNVGTCGNLTAKETEVWGQYIQAKKDPAYEQAWAYKTHKKCMFKRKP